MARALSTNTTLKRLDLQESTLFGENEWISIFQCFQRPGSELESLCLSDAANVPAALFNALSSNRTLKYIDLSFIEGITTNQWMSLATSLNNMPLEKLRLHMETKRTMVEKKLKLLQSTGKSWLHLQLCLAIAAA